MNCAGRDCTKARSTKNSLAAAFLYELIAWTRSIKRDYGFSEHENIKCVIVVEFRKNLCNKCMEFLTMRLFFAKMVPLTSTVSRESSIGIPNKYLR